MKILMTLKYGSLLYQNSKHNTNNNITKLQLNLIELYLYL